ncbi:IclR family transcriptional regulator [Aureimonas sp. ME7]|uniref:IclR family transcriptional regulator n=1 Tax=Aureimonas sp. ME7 TaxID=2744252 RepID=UPI0015F94175|nr:IclR family transcriptional regulator [Aureimonas sp. ME7]
MSTVEPKEPGTRRDPLLVQSVEKAFRILEAFSGSKSAMGLSQLAEKVGMDVSAAQRFTHTLVRLGYLARDPETRRYHTTSKNLRLGHNFLHGQRIVDVAMPYLMHLSKETEETVNLTLLEDTQILFVARFLSRHMLNTDVVIGTTMPAYCTAPGIAMLSRLPEDEAVAVIEASELVQHTEHTTATRDALIAKIRTSARQGYATAFGEYFQNDASIAAAIMDERGRPEAAVNIAVSYARCRPDEVVPRFATIVMAAARSISRA